MKLYRLLIPFLALTLLLDFPAAVAQSKSEASILSSNKNRIERLNRKNLRDAEKYQSDFKDTHLNTDIYGYKNGKSGRKAAKSEKAAAKREKAKAAKEQKLERKRLKRAKRQ